MPVEMVLGEIKHGRRIRLEAGGGLELEARQFQHPYIRQCVGRDGILPGIQRRRADVAGFVAGGDHHAETGVQRLLARWARHHPMGQTELLQEGQLAEPTVGQRREQGDVPGQQATLPLFQHLPAGQVEQVAHVVGSEPALRRLRLPLPQPLGGLQQRLPEPVVETHHQPRARVAEGLKPLKHPLYVLQGVEGVGQQDHVKRLGLAQARGGDRFGVGGHDAELRMPLLGDGRQLRIQLHPHAMAGLQLGQQVAQAAADLQHPQAWGHQQLVQPLQIGVVGAVAPAEALLLLRVAHA